MGKLWEKVLRNLQPYNPKFHIDDPLHLILISFEGNVFWVTALD